MDVVWAVIVFGSCVLLAWFGFRIEPHWVSKDGQRFICNSQRISGRGEPQGKWRETRVILNDGDRVQVDQKRFMRRHSTFWKLTSQSDAPPKNKEIFLLTGFDDTGAAAMLAIRLPKKSRAIPHLQAVIERATKRAAKTAETATSSPSEGTRPSTQRSTIPSPPGRENGRSVDRSDPD